MSTALPHSSPATVRVVCVVYHPGEELATFARPPVIGGGERVGEVEPLVALRRR